MTLWNLVKKQFSKHLTLFKTDTIFREKNSHSFEPLLTSSDTFSGIYSKNVKQRNLYLVDLLLGTAVIY